MLPKRSRLVPFIVLAAAIFGGVSCAAGAGDTSCASDDCGASGDSSGGGSGGTSGTSGAAGHGGETASDTGSESACGDGVCQPPEETAADCPADCAACAPLADVTALIDSGELFFGYSALGTTALQPGCGGLGEAHEVIVSLTPDFTGELVLSTQHPTTKLDTALEVREQGCDGPAIGCSGQPSAGLHGSRLVVPVEAGKPYVALIETADDELGVFALGLHRSGVCEGQGITEDITADLLSGRRFEVDTSASTSSLRGSCSAASDDNPEARLSFTAPRSGAMAGTTIHPKTAFNALLHLRGSPAQGTSYCDAPEAELACAAAGSAGAIVRFDAMAGRAYELFIDGAGANAEGQATLTLGYAHMSPAKDALQGCSHTAIQDQLALLVQSGQSVSLKADTVDAATAADLRMRIRLPDGAELFEADDQTPCTFPPPKYSCPQHSFTATATGLYTVEIYVGSSESCFDHGLVNYELTATLDGQPSELILFKDQ